MMPNRYGAMPVMGGQFQMPPQPPPPQQGFQMNAAMPMQSIQNALARRMY
jgi:hypothetical protein